jgi:hypothetical protein
VPESPIASTLVDAVRERILLSGETFVKLAESLDSKASLYIVDETLRRLLASKPRG